MTQVCWTTLKNGNAYGDAQVISPGSDVLGGARWQMRPSVIYLLAYSHWLRGVACLQVSIEFPSPEGLQLPNLHISRWSLSVCFIIAVIHHSEYTDVLTSLVTYRASHPYSEHTFGQYIYSPNLEVFWATNYEEKPALFLGAVTSNKVKQRCCFYEKYLTFFPCVSLFRNISFAWECMYWELKRHWYRQFPCVSRREFWNWACGQYAPRQLRKF